MFCSVLRTAAVGVCVAGEVLQPQSRIPLPHIHPLLPYCLNRNTKKTISYIY